MVTKVWQAEDIRNHLLAAQVGVWASVPGSLIPDEDGRQTALYQGCDAALKYLAKRFGVNLDSAQPARKTQTGELRLKTWTREDIERNLKVAWAVLHSNSPLPQKQDIRLSAYYKGIHKTLLSLAMSFDLTGFTLPSNEG